MLLKMIGYNMKTKLLGSYQPGVNLIDEESTFRVLPNRLEIHDGEQILGSDYLGKTCFKGTSFMCLIK